VEVAQTQLRNVALRHARAVLQALRARRLRHQYDVNAACQAIGTKLRIWLGNR
jgi:hypothetical protein